MDRFGYVVGAVVLAAALCGCKPDAPSARVAPEPEFRVAEVRVVTGAEKAGPAGPQSADKPVVVRIRTAGRSNGQTLQARLVELSTGVEMGLLSQGPKPGEAATALSFTPPSGGWTPGRYLLEITLDGKLVSQQDIDIFPSGV